MKHSRDTAQSNILRSVADAFEKSTKPFSVENYRLANLGSAMTVENPVPRHAVTDNVWVDFQADKGSSVVVSPGITNQGLRLLVKDLGQSRWFSFSYELGVDVMRSARYLGLLIRAGSTGTTAFRPCLRYIFEGSFQDQFTPQMLVFRGGVEEQLCFIKPDFTLLDRALRIEVLFFFEGKVFDVTLLGVENLLV